MTYCHVKRGASRSFSQCKGATAGNHFNAKISINEVKILGLARSPIGLRFVVVSCGVT